MHVKRTTAIVLAGGEGERLSILSGVRAKPAVPFAGKYRIIDFTLSNCVNSDINDVIVLTQYNPRSLNDHIGAGRPWDLDRSTGGIRLMQPYIARNRAAEWYRGTADAVLQNIRAIEESASDIVLILAGDHIYKMDYQPFVQQHKRKRADVTIAVKRVPIGEAHRFGILALDENDAVTEWQEKPKQPKSDLASPGHLRVLQARPAALADGGPLRLRRQRHPGHAGRRCPGLRLPLRRLLAGCRHGRELLADPDGAPGRPPAARPV